MTWRCRGRSAASGAFVKCERGVLYGQLGDGGSTNRTRTVGVLGLSDAVEIAAGGNHTCARRATGAVACWGRNTFGESGAAAADPQRTPIDVPGL